MFDIVSYLESRNIRYSTEGKNVSEGWVNIQCIYPNCADSSNHLGINLISGLHNCWVCGNKGGPEKLIQLVENCSRSEAYRIVKEFGTFRIDESSHIHVYRTKDFHLPKEIVHPFPKIHRKFLEGRHFDPDYVISKYKLEACHTLGKFRFRIIAPIFLDDRLVNYVGMGIMDRGKAGPKYKKYKNASNKEAPIKARDLLYNIDNVTDSAVLVEGITDVWRIGDGAIASIGSEVTEPQIALLVWKGIKRLFISPDRDAYEESQILAKRVSKLIDYVEIIKLPYGDPDKFFYENPSDLAELRKLLD